MKFKDLKKFKLPDKPGVYFFMSGKEILYIGKATSLRDRVKSYLSADRQVLASRGPIILDMVTQADKIKTQETDSVLEALILEAELIKKHKPKYNTKEKDDKSWNYVCITNDEVPKVIIKRGKELQKVKQNFLSCALPGIPGGTLRQKNFASPLSTFGPYTNGLQLREAMKIIRRIFPYIDGDSIKKNNKEFYKQLGLTPESLVEYKENIKNLKLFFQGKKKKIIKDLKKEMMHFAKMYQFEKAHEIKRKIFALEHINDIALIKSADEASSQFLVLRPSRNTGWDPQTQKSERSFARIEAYDIAHLSGKNMVGVMTVVENGEIKKSEYKKFIIKTQDGTLARQSRGGNDTGALREVLERRLRHFEWGMPDLIVVDGNIAQINVVKKVLSLYKMNIPVVSVVKNEKHKPKAILGDEKIIKKNKKEILLVNYEAHRFAINFYRQKSRRGMMG